MYLFSYIEKQLVHECGQKGKKPFLVHCKNDETNESLNSFDNHMQTSRPLLSNNSLTVVSVYLYLLSLYIYISN